MTAAIDCIVADWGSSNRRAWAMTRQGEIVAELHDGEGLLSVKDRQFAASFQAFCGDWLAQAKGVPVIMAGMVGSKLGWQEVPYEIAPVTLRGLSQALATIREPGFETYRIVPGVAIDDPRQPEVMRGEECQILGALQQSGGSDGIFLLPGTHSKWAFVQDGRLTTFRTYMTGEIFGLLRKSGTLSQLMEGDATDENAFRRGVEQAQKPDAANLLHSLFSVRTLGLFEQVARPGLASYMSGLLIGSEIRDAVTWLYSQGKVAQVSAIGSPGLLKAYQQAAEMMRLPLVSIDSAQLLPVALLSLATDAGLLK